MPLPKRVSRTLVASSIFVGVLVVLFFISAAGESFILWQFPTPLEQKRTIAVQKLLGDLTLCLARPAPTSCGACNGTNLRTFSRHFNLTTLPDALRTRLAKAASIIKENGINNTAMTYAAGDWWGKLPPLANVGPLIVTGLENCCVTKTDAAGIEAMWAEAQRTEGSSSQDESQQFRVGDLQCHYEDVVGRRVTTLSVALDPVSVFQNHVATLEETVRRHLGSLPQEWAVTTAPAARLVLAQYTSDFRYSQGAYFAIQRLVKDEKLDLFPNGEALTDVVGYRKSLNDTTAALIEGHLRMLGFFLVDRVLEDVNAAWGYEPALVPMKLGWPVSQS